MKKYLFLLFVPTLLFAQTNTNVVNIYSTPKLATIFDQTYFVTNMNVVSNFTNVTITLSGSVISSLANSNTVIRTNAEIYAEGSIPFLRFTNGIPVWGNDYSNRLIAIFDNTDTTGKVAMLVFGSMDPFKNSFQMLWNPIHDSGYTNYGGEMQITFPNLALGPGWNSGLTNFFPGGYNPTGRRIQLGIGENHRGWMDIHFDSPGNTAAQPMSDTLPLRWQLQYLNNGNAIEVYPTIRGYTWTTNGDYGLTLWKNFDTGLTGGKTNYVLNDNYYESWRYIDFIMGNTNRVNIYVDAKAKTLSTDSQPTGVPTQTNSVTYLILTNNGIRYYIPSYTNSVAP